MDIVYSEKKNIQSHKLLRRLIYPGCKVNYHGVADWFLFSVFVLPSYFGIRLVFFDLTAVRFFEILLIYMILRNPYRRREFINMIKNCPNLIWMVMYVAVVTYTNVLHISINTILYWLTNCILLWGCMLYLIINEYGIDIFLQKIKKYAWILCGLSPIQIITGFSPFAVLDTLGKVTTTSRFGEIRIMGNCTVANGYAMYLTILLPIICYDYKGKKINLWKNFALLMGIIINVFLTGSRLSVGIMLLEIFLCGIMQYKKQLKQSFMAILIGIPILILILYSLQNVSFVRGLLRTFFSFYDEIMKTNYAVQFGADSKILYNSTYYRELLWKNTIGGGWLNPWLGKGGSYNFGLYVEGYRIYSCDNFYVGQYIAYGIPGVVTWLLMSASFLIQSIKSVLLNKNKLMWVLTVSIICYYISLWYLDQLQTFPYMMGIFALVYSERYRERGLEKNE